MVCMHHTPTAARPRHTPAIEKAARGLPLDFAHVLVQNPISSNPATRQYNAAYPATCKAVSPQRLSKQQGSVLPQMPCARGPCALDQSTSLRRS